MFQISSRDRFGPATQYSDRSSIDTADECKKRAGYRFDAFIAEQRSPHGNAQRNAAATKWRCPENCEVTHATSWPSPFSLFFAIRTRAKQNACESCNPSYRGALSNVKNPVRLCRRNLGSRVTKPAGCRLCTSAKATALPSFHVAARDDGSRTLSADCALVANDLAEHSGKYFVSQAFAYAKKYFRDTGPIDKD
jgi:hypothetical protein